MAQADTPNWDRLAQVAQAPDQLSLYPAPTITRPGTDEKLSVLAFRARHFLRLFVPHDADAKPEDLDRVAHDRKVEANGRPVEPNLLEECVARQTRCELDLRLNTNDLAPFIAVFGARLGNAALPTCPRCGWWYRKSGRCTWCWLDIEAAVKLARLSAEEDRMADHLAKEAEEDD